MSEGLILRSVLFVLFCGRFDLNQVIDDRGVQELRTRFRLPHEEVETAQSFVVQVVNLCSSW